MQRRAVGGPAVRSGVVAAAGLAGLAALTQSWRLSWLAAAFAALYLGGARATTAARLVIAVPAAAVLAWQTWPVHQSWLRWVLFAVVVLAAVAVPDLERRWSGTGATPLFGLLAAGGVYACVPETGHLRFVAWVFVVLAVGEVVFGHRRGAGLAVAATALLTWAVVYGGTYREGSVVGGFASLGLLVVEPLAVRLPGPRRPLVGPRPLRVGALLVLQGGSALLVGRTAGLRVHVGPALTIAVPMLAALAVAARLVSGRRGAAGRVA